VWEGHRKGRWSQIKLGRKVSNEKRTMKKELT
jgi:hypothetical protein